MAFPSETVASQVQCWTERALGTIKLNMRHFEGQVIVTPSPTYGGFWARDTMIVALGLMDIGLFEPAAALLRSWSRHQIKSDDEPGTYILLNKHRLNWSEGDITNPTPLWLSDNRGGLPTCVYLDRPDFPDGTREIYSCHPDPDGTAWWLVACGRYVVLSGDEHFRSALQPSLQAAMDNLARRDSDGDLLIEQCPNEDWADHMRRHGKVTYTQAVWFGAVQAAGPLGLDAPSAAAVRRHIRSRLVTRQGRPCDWTCPRTRSDRLAQDSALLVLMGVLDRDEAGELLGRLDRLAAPYGHRVVTPAFRRSRMGPYHFKVGEYQNAAIWTWLSGWEAQARASVGDIDTALRLIAGCFCPTCDRIYEWINPVTGDRYNSHFATGAGSILSAIALCGSTT